MSTTTRLKAQGDALLYDGVPLALDPVGTTLSSVAVLIADDRPAYVDLQPGDGTSYRFLLLPATATPTAWLLRVSDAGMADAVLFVREPAHTTGTNLVRVSSARRDLDALYAHEHTKDVLAWWLRRLWAVVAECRAVNMPDPLGRDALKPGQYYDTAGKLRYDGRIGADDDHSGPAAAFAPRETDDLRNADWRCLYCRAQVAPLAPCMKPACVQQRDAAARRMGMESDGVQLGAGMSMRVLVVQDGDTAVAALRREFPELVGTVSTVTRADDGEGPRCVIFSHTARVGTRPLRPRLGSGDTWTEAFTDAHDYLARMAQGAR